MFAQPYLTYNYTKTSAYTANYSSNGNIVRKSDFGLYAYSGSRPHAVSGISSLIAGTGAERTCEAEYNTIGKVSKLVLKNGGTTLKTATFTYAADGQRRKMQIGNSTTIYCDDYQVNKTGSTEQRLHYISGPAGLCALIVQNYNNGSLASRVTYYLQTDYQGSIIAAYNSNGTLYKRFAYDPWGRRRNGSNWTNYQTDTETLITRGYCGHEHLDDFGTINMNGRIYDPRLGRFLSPDPYVQAPDNSQNYNRYSYCLNNPLKYTDPDGEWIHILIGALVGGTINVLTHLNDIDNIWEGIASFSVGAGAGALTAVTGGATSGFWASTTVGYCAAAVAGGSLAASNNIIQQSNGTTLKGIDWGQVGNSALYGIGGSLASSFVGCPFDGGRNLSHTLNHISRSAAYNFGGKLASGRNPFKNIDGHYLGLNWSAIIPLAADGTKYYVNHKTDIGNRLMNKNDKTHEALLQDMIDESNKENNYNLTSGDYIHLGFSETELTYSNKGTYYFHGIFNCIVPYLGQNNYEKNKDLELYCESKGFNLGILFNLFLFK